MTGRARGFAVKSQDRTIARVEWTADMSRRRDYARRVRTLDGSDAAYLTLWYVGSPNTPRRSCEMPA